MWIIAAPQRLPVSYEMQCFFVARNEANSERYIYNVRTTQITDEMGSRSFQAPPLLGKGIPFIKISKGRRRPRYVVNNFKGSDVEGWIVRVVAEGTVLSIESNQGYLKDLAQEAPDLLDSALRSMQ